MAFDVQVELRLTHWSLTAGAAALILESLFLLLVLGIVCRGDSGVTNVLLLLLVWYTIVLV